MNFWQYVGGDRLPQSLRLESVGLLLVISKSYTLGAIALLLLTNVKTRLVGLTVGRGGLINF